MVIVNPFRVGIDGNAAVCREKYRRLRWYVKRHPEVGIVAGLVASPSRKGSPVRVRNPKSFGEGCCERREPV